jgi:excisionase family DNA binding protein
MEDSLVERKSINVHSILSESQPLWTVEEVADFLRLKPETIRIMARKGELPSIKIGKRIWRFKVQELKDWVNNNSIT